VISGGSSPRSPNEPCGTLFLVATPIGNLEDITLRALRTLREVDIIAAEDTRVTVKLLSHYDIRKPMFSYHRHSRPGVAGKIVALLKDGKNVALTCDAGTPGVSDPGEEVVRACIREGLPVVAIPGPSALIAALAVSGLPTSSLVFTGFLPRRSSERRKLLEALCGQPQTLVFFEAPHRLVACLKDVRQVLGDRQAVVARELTKKFEEIARGTLSQLVRHFEEASPRGEAVVLVAGAAPLPARPGGEQLPESRLNEAIALARSLRSAGTSTRSAAMRAAENLKVPWRGVYRALLAR